MTPAEAAAIRARARVVAVGATGRVAALVDAIEVLRDGSRRRAAR